MIDVDRINFLAKKSRTEGLTPEEAEEQAKLRREYIDAYKASLTAQRDSIVGGDEHGNKRP